jgi:beta-lactamase regulating signal transducer with metallopeptidase domain
MNAISDPLASMIVSQLAQVTAVALAVGVVVRLACRRRPHLAYALWMLVVVKSLTPPLWSSPTGVFSWLHAEMSAVNTGALAGGFAAMPGEPLPLLESPADQSGPPAAALPAAPRNRYSLSSISTPGALVAVWLAGVGVMGVVVLVRRVQCARLLRASALAVDESLRSHTNRLAERIGLRRQVRVLVSSEPIGPAVFGVLCPTVVLPARLLDEKQWPEFEPILAHELVHVRRWDTLAGGLQVVAQVLWWFHPLVWWTNREARRERERCCDQEVLARLRCGPSAYARALLHVLQWRRTLRPAFALSATDTWSFEVLPI